MSTILITGGTGTFGRDLTALLQPTAHTLRIMSRKPAPPDLPANIEWAVANLATGTGVDDAVRGADIIINAASDSGGNTHLADVVGLQLLLNAAQSHKIGHFLHISIVGIDQMPFGYYRHKLDAEAVVSTAAIPYSIARITQFHSLVLGIFEPLLKIPDAPLRIPTDIQFQSIDSREAAAQTLTYLHTPANGRLPDTGGPEVLMLGDMAQILLDARKDSRPIEPTLTPDPKLFWPSPEAIAAYRRGLNTAPDHRCGSITWRDFVT